MFWAPAGSPDRSKIFHGKILHVCLQSLRISKFCMYRNTSNKFTSFLNIFGAKNEKSRFYRWKSSKIEKIKPKIENLGLLESKSRVSLSFKVFEVVFWIFENFLFDMPKTALFEKIFIFRAPADTQGVLQSTQNFNTMWRIRN